MVPGALKTLVICTHRCTQAPCAHVTKSSVYSYKGTNIHVTRLMHTHIQMHVHTVCTQVDTRMCMKHKHTNSPMHTPCTPFCAHVRIAAHVPLHASHS